MKFSFVSIVSAAYIISSASAFHVQSPSSPGISMMKQESRLVLNASRAAKKKASLTKWLDKRGFNDQATTIDGTSVNKLEAILWDMDGVLADTERDAHRPAFNVAFQENNLDTEWDVERYGKLLEVGGGKERMTAHWNEVGWPENFPEGEERQQKVKELHLRKTDIFMDLINQGDVPLRPGVLRVIDAAIDSGLQLAVCSNSNEKAVRNLVHTLMGPEREAKFQIFAGDMVQKKKPAPDVYNMYEYNNTTALYFSYT